MDRRTINKIVVVGGGSAGWFAALYAKRLMPDKEITVIESESIGILGAGEGTTPHIESLMQILDIPLSDLINNTQCTIKNGIKFLNWNGGGESDYFYNGFFGYQELNFSYYDLGYLDSSAPMHFACPIFRDESFAEVDFASVISDLNKVPFTKSIDEDGRINYRNVSKYALHVDASKLASYLKKVATEQRGIKRVEGIVVDYSQDSFGDVRTLVLDSGESIPCDFVFDCSGFARFFPRKFETDWKSHEDILPSDSALPFFIPMSDDDPIPTAGLAVAMDYGWMWNTPLQHRYGCGYVFNSELISFDEAKKEVETYLGLEIDPIKEIKYKAGYYKEPWKYNVVSMGLASGFIEPLEASSMWVTIVFMRQVFSNLEVLYNRSEKVAQDFNREFQRMNDQVADFIYFHHMTSRNDTEFWRSFTEDKAPDGLKKVLDIFEARMPGSIDFDGNYWDMHLWYRVGIAHGNEKIINSIKRSNDYNPWIPVMLERYDSLKSQVDFYASKCVDHREFISDLRDL